ncbi:FHA domain-containing protein [Dactylosporangium sp. CA-233914]|uniref:FHA domain-containing protein n=1 Tax=Dactylosporangium sp. CA-233914 TaxID=3239934 RepID=UPI003D8F4004
MRFEISRVMDTIEQRLTTDVTLAQAVVDLAEVARFTALDGGRPINLLRLGMVVDALSRYLIDAGAMLYPVAGREVLSEAALTSKERMVLGRWADDGLIEVTPVVADRPAEIADFTGLPLIVVRAVPHQATRFPWIADSPERVLRLTPRAGGAVLTPGGEPTPPKDGKERLVVIGKATLPIVPADPDDKTTEKPMAEPSPAPDTPTDSSSADPASSPPSSTEPPSSTSPSSASASSASSSSSSASSASASSLSPSPSSASPSPSSPSPSSSSASPSSASSASSPSGSSASPPSSSASPSSASSASASSPSPSFASSASPSSSSAPSPSGSSASPSAAPSEPSESAATPGPSSKPSPMKASADAEPKGGRPDGLQTFTARGAQRQGRTRVVRRRFTRADPSGVGASLMARQWRCKEPECPAFGEYRRIGQPVPRMRAGVPACPRHGEAVKDIGPRPPAYAVAIVVEDLARRRFVVAADHPVIVGRDPANPDDISVAAWLHEAAASWIAKEHVRLSVVNGKLQVTDLSDNGTLIWKRSTPDNKEETERIYRKTYELVGWDSVELYTGVELVVGDHRLQTVVGSEPASVLLDAPTVALRLVD